MKTLNSDYKLQLEEENDIFLKIVGIIYVQSEQYPDWSFPLHSHENDLELSLVLGGGGTVYYAGKTYHVQAGDLIVKNAAILHSEVTDQKDPIEQICMILTGVRSDGSLSASLLPAHTPPILKTGSSFPFLRQMFLYIMDIYEKKPHGFELALHNTLKALLSSILLLTPSSDETSVTDSTDSVIRDVVEYINEHYAENITLETLSSRFFFSSCYLARKFKEETGYTVNQYIISRRMGEAEKLLIFDNMSIKDVAEKIGYSNLQYFYATFKKFTGCTPAEFKRLYLPNQ
jgi:AraC-like DNA-binding protein